MTCDNRENERGGGEREEGVKGGEEREKPRERKGGRKGEMGKREKNLGFKK